MASKKNATQQGLVTETLTVPNISPNFKNAEIGMTFYSDSKFLNVVGSGVVTGQVTLTAMPHSNSYEQMINGGPMDLSDPYYLETPTVTNIALRSVTATPSNIQGATHWQLIVISHGG